MLHHSFSISSWFQNLTTLHKHQNDGRRDHDGDTDFYLSAASGRKLYPDFDDIPRVNLHGRHSWHSSDRDYRTHEFSTLSYSWGMNSSGDATEQRQISIDGHIKPVTQNLFEGLRRIRCADRSLQIWIDAVCINQQDISERNIQVSQMADIYRNAAQVLAWLGEGDSEEKDNAAYVFLRRMERHFPAKPPFGDNTRYFHSCVLASLTDDPWTECACSRADGLGGDLYESENCHPLDKLHRFTLRNLGLLDNWIKGYVEPKDRIPGHVGDRIYATYSLLNRRYWSRRWIIPELYRAKNTSWYWGSVYHELSLSDLTWVEPFRTVSSGFNGNLSIWERCGRRSPSPQMLSSTVPDLREILCSNFQALDLISNLHKFECSDDRDRLFALCSVLQEHVKPDYNLTFPQTCTLFTKLLLEHADVRRWLENLAEIKSHYSERIEDKLPSWVVNILVLRGFKAPSSPMSASYARATLDGVLSCDVHCVGIVTNPFKTIRLPSQYGLDYPSSGRVTVDHGQDLTTDTGPREQQVMRWYQRYDDDGLGRLKPHDALCALIHATQQLEYERILVLRPHPEAEGTTYEIVYVLRTWGIMTEIGANGSWHPAGEGSSGSLGSELAMEQSEPSSDEGVESPQEFLETANFLCESIGCRYAKAGHLRAGAS